MARAAKKTSPGDTGPNERGKRRHRLVFFSELFDPLDPELIDQLIDRQGAVTQPDECSIQIVQQALGTLLPNERAVVEQYHFHGRPLRQVAQTMQKTRSMMVCLLGHAEEKLKAALLPYVTERFGIGTSVGKTGCRICAQPQRAAITQLLLTKTKEETWSPVLKQLKAKYGLDKLSPRTLIAHLRHATQRQPKG